MTALIIGSIPPDFEYFFRVKMQNVYSRSAAGLFLFDVSACSHFGIHVASFRQRR
jgi:hypothetical protein